MKITNPQIIEGFGAFDLVPDDDQIGFFLTNFGGSRGPYEPNAGRELSVVNVPAENIVSLLKGEDVLAILAQYVKQDERRPGIHIVQYPTASISLIQRKGQLGAQHDAAVGITDSIVREVPLFVPKRGKERKYWGQLELGAMANQALCGHIEHARELASQAT